MEKDFEFMSFSELINYIKEDPRLNEDEIDSLEAMSKEELMEIAIDFHNTKDKLSYEQEILIIERGINEH